MGIHHQFVILFFLVIHKAEVETVGAEADPTERFANVAD
jgi:hypothetical protein